MLIMKIWFKKVAWSYIPCTVEGFAVVFPAVALGLLGLWGISYIEEASGIDLDLAKAALFIVALLMTLLVAKRHSG